MTQAQIRAGLLLPPSGVFPQQSEQFAAGLRLGLEQALPGQVTLLEEPVSSGKLQAENVLRYWLPGRKVDFVVALAQPGLAAVLADLLPRDRAWLLACDAGANIPRLSEILPAVLYSTLGLWQANFALGRWAAENLGRAVVMATGFYESGYDLNYAFQLGFEQGGGQVQRLFLTHLPPDTGDFAPIFEEVAASGAPLLYGGYSGTAALQFLRAAAGLAGVSLLAPATLVDGPWLAEAAVPTPPIYTAASWDAALPSAANRAFQEAYQRHAGQPAGPFAVLGWDTAHLLPGVLAAAGLLGDGSPQAGSQLAAAFDGPRGPVRLDPDTRVQRSAARAAQDSLAAGWGRAPGHRPAAPRHRPGRSRPDCSPGPALRLV
jgi:ABC-type branched-subunit amino acid transport system substrate-binding protein